MALTSELETKLTLNWYLDSFPADISPMDFSPTNSSPKTVPRRSVLLTNNSLKGYFPELQFPE